MATAFISFASCYQGFLDSFMLEYLFLCSLATENWEVGFGTWNMNSFLRSVSLKTISEGLVGVHEV